MSSERPLEAEGWFYPNLNRAQSESKLKEHGQDGSFLIRECENPRGIFVLSYRKSDFIFHSKIDAKDGHFSMAGGRKFESISSLVHFYTHNDGILKTDTGAVVNIHHPYYEMDHSQVRWYHGYISDEQASSRLKNSAEEYNFLVRESSSSPGVLSLVVKNGQDIANIRIVWNKDSNKYELNGTSFNNLPEMIAKSQEFPLKGDSGATIVLKKPLNKPRPRGKSSSLKYPRPGSKSASTSPRTSPREDETVDGDMAMTAVDPAARLVIRRRSSSTLSSGSNGSGGFPEVEPLYQVYHRGVVTRDVVQQVRPQSEEYEAKNSSDGDDASLLDEASLKRHVSNILRQSQISPLDPGDMSGARQSCLFDVLKHGMGQLNLWRHLPEVQRSGVLQSMDGQQKRLQESLFEIITSEASYLKSLNVLMDHFYSAPVFRIDGEQSVLTKQNQRFVFSNIKKVLDVSKGLLQELRALRKKNCVLNPAEMGSLIKDYAQKHFEAYVVYAKNQAYQGRALSELREKFPKFSQEIKKLERDPKSQHLPFESFLLLPVQRVTRMPLLLDSAVSGLDESQPGYRELKECFFVMQKIVIRCNEEAKLLADIEQVAKISEMLHFKTTKKIALVSQQRHLVKEGEVTNLGPYVFDFPERNPYPIYLFLFNDMLVISKRKGAGSFEVLESAPRTAVEVDVISEDDVTEHLPKGISPEFRNLFLLQIKEREITCVVSCKTMSDQMRWEEALSPEDEPSRTVELYNDKDCPQAQALQPYRAREPDELALEEADIVSVTMKLGDGWWQGSRIRDGVRGWFPSSVVVEIQSAHMRARNRRQQYRLMFSMYKRASDEFIC